MNELTKILLILFVIISGTIHAQNDQLYLTDENRWLEETEDKAVKKWIDKQNETTEKYLRKARYRQLGINSIGKYGYINYNWPSPEGDKYYKILYNSGGYSAGLYTMNKINSNPLLLVNPRDISRDERIDISSYKTSPDGKYLAVYFGRNGSDWKEIKVKKLNAPGYIKDHIVDIKFSGVEWDNEGFYYVTYPRKGKFDAEGRPRLMYHKLKTDQKEDEVVFERNTDKLLKLDFQVTKSKDFLIVSESINYGETQNYYYKDLRVEDSPLLPLLPKLNATLNVIANIGDTLIFTTGQQAGNGSVNFMNVNDPLAWKTLIPKPGGERKKLLWCRLISGKLVCHYWKDMQQFMIDVYDFSGNKLYGVEFQKGYRVSGFSDNGNQDECVFSMQNYFTPPVVYRMDMNTFETELIKKTEVTFDVEEYESKIVEYPAKDGVMIPLTIVHKKGLELNSANPTLLKTYGGFGQTHLPSFSKGLVYFMENGGIFAYAHVRGEGIKGPAWARAGKREGKLTSISDFISAAEYLIAEKYTSPANLGIVGASNGGMMVGAAMTQRPELFKAAVPIVGVHDMLDFVNYTTGVFYKEEYGFVDNPSDAKVLRSYSPYHNIKKGVNYPTTMVMTSENDIRVPPFHSYKFASRLQNNPGQTNQILLRVEKMAGHDGANSYLDGVFETADMYAFLLNELKPPK